MPISEKSPSFKVIACFVLEFWAIYWPGKHPPPPSMNRVNQSSVKTNLVMRFSSAYKAHLSVTAVISVVIQMLCAFQWFCPKSLTFKRKLDKGPLYGNFAYCTKWISSPSYIYSKGDHDGAIQQYIRTIGHLEASYVIRKVKHFNSYFFSVSEWRRH